MSRYDEIYQAALEGDTEKLKQLKAQGPLDCRQGRETGLFTPGKQLALEGRHAAVECLRRLGASVKLIAVGYALGGHHEVVERYRTMDNAVVNSIAYGYALGGHHEAVERYRTMHNAVVNSIVHGYAQGGHHEALERYRTAHNADVNNIAIGYAVGGHHEAVERYRTVHKADVNLIAVGYAQGGHHAAVEKYRTTHKADVNHIASAYSTGGYLAEAARYRAMATASRDAKRGRDTESEALTRDNKRARVQPDVSSQSSEIQQFMQQMSASLQSLQQTFVKEMQAMHEQVSNIESRLGAVEQHQTRQTSLLDGLAASNQETRRLLREQSAQTPGATSTDSLRARLSTFRRPAFLAPATQTAVEDSANASTSQVTFDQG